jgi:hypothetical protein
MKNKLLALFRRKQSVYGSHIFRQRSWLSRQVDEAVRKRAFHLD